jgi:hypothetical protein
LFVAKHLKQTKGESKFNTECEREAIFKALAADPDNKSLYEQLADVLEREGDPRGTFMKAQLDLEDPTVKGAKRGACARARRSCSRRTRASCWGAASTPTCSTPTPFIGGSTPGRTRTSTSSGAAGSTAWSSITWTWA